MEYLLSHLMRHYSYIYKGKYLDGETFSSTWGSLVIQTSNTNQKLETVIPVLFIYVSKCF